MKTLVIHPDDPTTYFLTDIYSDTSIKQDWTIINTNVPNKVLRKHIEEHDRIIMLGHGTPDGLLGYGKYVIDFEYVSLLKEKECVCIWCNADQFVEKHNIKGFYTGMIISEVYEAKFCGVEATSREVFDSNILFASTIKKSFDV